MSWLLPGFLGAGFAVALPVILHFLRSKPKAIIDFPTLRFLAEAAIRDTKKHRLRRWITLALRCLIIGLLAAGFARPFFANFHSGGGQIMIVAVDNSLGMQALGRWNARRDWAVNQLKDLGSGDEAGILMMQPTPAWLAPVSGNIEQVRETLSAMQPGFEKAHYTPALRLAGQTLAAMPARSKTIIWMSDEQKAGWLGTQFDEPLPTGVKIRFADTAPHPDSQAAITTVQWARDGFNRAVQVNIRLYAPDAKTRQLTVKTGGKVIAQQSANLKAGAEQAILIPLKNASDAAAAIHQGVSVSMDPDDLAADDTAWLAPRDDTARTVLYSPGSGPASHFLDHALGSLEQFDADPLTDQPFPQGDWPAGAVAIATSDCFQPPLLDHLNHFVAAGGAVWIVVDGSEPQMQWLAGRGVRVTLRPQADEPEHLRDWDLDHPILGAFAGQSVLPLMEVEFTRSFGLSGETLTPIANWPDGSAGLAEMTLPGGRVFLSGFPLDRSATNWPVQPSFVPFVHQTLRWLAALQRTKTDWRIGDTIPLGDRDGTWRAIDTARSQPDIHESGSVRPTIPGLYEFNYADGNTHKIFAVNAPLGQSDLTPWPDPNQLLALESKAGPEKEQVAEYTAVKLSDEAAESQQRLWWWLLAIVAVALLAELAVANRTAV
jgi:hypothetical protein